LKPTLLAESEVDESRVSKAKSGVKVKKIKTEEEDEMDHEEGHEEEEEQSEEEKEQEEENDDNDDNDDNEGNEEDEMNLSESSKPLSTLPPPLPLSASFEWDGIVFNKPAEDQEHLEETDDEETDEGSFCFLLL